jgi:tetratricopeptide (TPR) repeat protein
VCRFKESDIWLRRAARIARWYSDWEAFADALTSIGMLAYRQGNIPRARTHLDRALRVARRQGLRQLEGEILHDRFTVAFTSNEKIDAEAFARAAYERYLPSHERLPALAYDVAYFWLTRGYARRAFAVLRLLRPHFDQPAAQFQVLCASARAAGASGERATFQAVWSEASRLLESAQSSAAFAIALVDLGYGAAHVGDWAHAEVAFARAADAALMKGQAEARIRAEAALDAVRRKENPDSLPIRRAGSESTELERELVSQLADTKPPGNAAGGSHRPPHHPDDPR